MLSILAIEDNSADTEMIRIYLKESKTSKYNLRCAETLTEGFYLLDEHPIDLVLLDLNLPDSNGFNTLRRYVGKYPDVPVVVMTGINDQRKGTESVRAGAQDYLVKGEFESRQLTTAIEYSLERFRIQAEAEKRATDASDQNDKLETLQKMASLGDWEMDIVNNSMTWSDGLFKIFQIPPHSLSPSLSDYLRYVHREDRDQVEDFFEKAVRFENYGPLDHRIMIDNRIVKNLSLRTRIRFDEKTNKVLLLGSVQDITPDEHNANPVPDASESPEEKKKRNAYYSRELFNQISFNVRTPLSTIVHLFYLLEQTALSKQQAILIKDLKTTFNDLSFTLSNLVNLSILSNDHLPSTTDQFRILDILESIQRVMTFKGQQHEREVDIYIDPRLSITAKGDSNKLAQLFFCLLELSFTYSKPASFIKVRCALNENEGENGELLVQLEYTGDLPEWPDTQTEATAEEILSLLKPGTADNSRIQLLAIVFLRLSEQLAIDRKTDEMNSAVSIDLRIPLNLSPQSVNIPREPQRDIHILLVEDHPMHKIATKQILTTWSDKVSVSLAGDGKQALEMARENAYTIVLMDLQMPGMNGWDAVTHMRHFTSVPIIALTASNSKQEEERCYVIGFNDYLAKPFQPEDLYHRIMLLIHEDE